MFISLLAVTFAVALGVSLIVSQLFAGSIRKILDRIIQEDISAGWLKYIRFAIIVVGVSAGVRIHALERYILPEREVRPLADGGERNSTADSRAEPGSLGAGGIPHGDRDRGRGGVAAAGVFYFRADRLCDYPRDGTAARQAGLSKVSGKASGSTGRFALSIMFIYIQRLSKQYPEEAMSINLIVLSRWAGRVAAGAILLIGLFWTWFGLACAWPDPLGMLMHTLIPGLPLVALGLACWWQPVFGGVVLALWGASPLLLLIGGRRFLTTTASGFL